MMNQSAYPFYLKVQRVERSCLFELSWGKGQQLSAMLPYPESLTILYQEWRSAYLNFYKTALRGRVTAKGGLTSPPVDWHAKLVQAEAALLYEFHQWLRCGELFEMRSRIAQAAKEERENTQPASIEVFLTCNPLEVARLPWETWELGAEFAAGVPIHFVRMPVNIHGVTVPSQSRRRRMRVLAILGDETGLNFQADRNAVQALSSLAEIKFVGWQPGQSAAQLKGEIVRAIADKDGWDILFFAGHSNETELTGGELAIAPGVSLLLSELAHPLAVAKEKGLQFALFNSCNGLSLAYSLIDLGLSQVAVMREPVHNQVAEAFLFKFLQGLAQYQDVREALLGACRYLKLEQHLTYPSAYLIPSLFRHPDAPLFRLKPFGIREKLRCWLPKKTEAIALSILALVSWQLSVQNALLEKRVLTQAIYRQITNQVPIEQEPPILIAEIDEESIRRAKISDPRPLDRSYLAQIIDKLAAINATVVGIDVVLDRHQEEHDPKLAKALRDAVQQQKTWFVFATQRAKTGGWHEVLPKLASLNWSLQGDIRVIDKKQISHVTLAPRREGDPNNLPFAYLLALAHWLNFEQPHESPQPQLSAEQDWLSQLTAFIENKTEQDYREIFSTAARLQPLTLRSYFWRQMWLHPIIDFSIPPDRVYDRLPIWQLLEEPASELRLPETDQPVVMVAAGGYGEAGVLAEGDDNFPVPAAVDYWRERESPPDLRQVFPGGEVHAYLIHHFLNRRLVVPIPDLWLVGVAAILGKGMALVLEQQSEERQRKPFLVGFFTAREGKWVLLLSGATAIYGLVSLQLYISTAILLPVVLPAATVWTYVLLALLERKSNV